MSSMSRPGEPTPHHAQTLNDALEHHLEHLPNPADRADVLLHTAQHCLPHDPDRALDLARRAHDAATTHAHTARAQHLTAAAHLERHRLDRALHHAAKALDAARDAQDPTLEKDALNLLGVLHHKNGDLDAAATRHLEHLELTHATGDDHGRATALNNLGNLYAALGEPGRALNYHLEALTLARATGDTSLETLATVNVGDDHARLGRPDDAAATSERAATLARRAAHPHHETTALTNLAAALLDLGRAGEALEHAREAARLARTLHDPALESAALDALGRAHTARDEHEPAVAALREAARLAELSGSTRRTFEAHEALSRALERAGRTTDALHHLREALRHERQLRAETTERRTRVIAARFEAERFRREAEHERLRAQTLADANAALLEANRRVATLAASLEHRASHDALTNLPNRALLDARLERAVAAAERRDTTLAVIFIDLDDFKTINDTLGHHAGDHVLVETARRLERRVRADDTVARVGGDEFIILVNGAPTTDDLHRLAARLTAAFDEPYRIGDTDAHVTASVGISVYPRDGRDATTLRRHADHAMYAAKRGAGRSAPAVTR